MGDERNPNIRISDSERDLALTALGEHLATGRLDLAEYESRSTRVAEARVRADLEALFGDLPAPHPDLSAAVPPSKKLVKKAKKSEPPAPPLTKTMESIAGFTLLLGIPAAILGTTLAGMWWLFFPVVGVFLVAASIGDSAKKKASGKG